ncbi:MAG: transketolase [Synergistaceae bacterium]|nr:transketolase [Synergistaceae bacterium]
MSLPKINKFVLDSLTGEPLDALKAAARRARVAALTMVNAAKSGHPAGAFSSMEMFLTVYGVADLTPENCNEIKRDYVIISHGHTSAGVYAALSEWGFIDRDEAMAHFRNCGSAFQGHIERNVPGIDWGTGNLGQGLSAGVGFALAQRANNHKGRVYVLMGDGGQTKGQIAEARRMAVKENLTGLTALIDYNDIQLSGERKNIMPCNIKEIWEADGWEAVEVDGHSFTELYDALKKAGSNGKPTVLLCHTIMGKDGGIMEGKADYHGKAVPVDAYAEIVKGLGEDPATLDRAIERRKNPPTYKGRKIDFPPVPNIDTGKPFDYEGKKISDNRGAFGKALADVGKLNYKVEGRTPILVFDCDLLPSVMTGKFREECPENFIQCGIQEHSVATASGTASIAGVVSLWAEFGVFGIDEVYNQQRLNDINHAGNKTVLTHVGLDVGEDGKTHQCIDYVGLMRNMFGWKLVVPVDPNQTDRATRWMLKTPGDICMAVGRSKIDALKYYSGDYKFEYGKADKLREGGSPAGSTDGAIFALGYTAQIALNAAEILERENNLKVSVYAVSCPLAPDIDAIKEAANSNFILTLEDHNVNTGMASVMILEAARAGIALPKLKTLGVTRYGASGTSDQVRKEMGISAEQVAQEFLKGRA